MKPDVILGLSGILGRFAVGLIVDGKVTFAVEEDKLRRFSGLGSRHLGEVDSRAVDLAVAKAPGGAQGVSRVAYVPAIDASSEQVAGDNRSIEEFLEREHGVTAPVSAVDHVESHLAFERAVHSGVDAVFMVGRSRAVYSPGPGQPPALDAACDIVRRFESLAAFAGFARRIHHLENMARFGEPRWVEPIEALLAHGADGETVENQLLPLTGLARRRRGQVLDPAHYDFAASLCRALQNQIILMLRSVPEANRGDVLAVCGGVFQSWSLNDALATAFPQRRIRTSFAPGNACGAIGGPLVLGGYRPDQLIGPFLGPEYDREEIKSVLDNSKVRYALHTAAETVDRVCGALEEGQMVGWFQGHCEFGYRALGSRSVFANPANSYACDNLSSYLKKRPSYFAYAVAIDSADPLVAAIESPYLSRSARLSDYFGEAPVRVQSVSPSGAPALFQLLKAFREKSGVPALLNTSLNYFDEPIACTPRDALKTFYASGLDMLVMEDFVLTKD